MQEKDNFRQATPQDHNSESMAVDALNIIVRHWRLLAVSITVSLCIGFSILHYATPRYRILASLLIRDDSRGTDFGESAVLNELGFSPGQSNVENEIEILKSRHLMEIVVDELPKQISENRNEKSQIIKNFQSRWKVTASNKMASLVTLSFTDEFPARGVQVVSSIIRNYQAINVQNQTERVAKKLHFLDDNLIHLKGRLEKSESDIEDFKRKYHDANVSSSEVTSQFPEILIRDRSRFDAQLTHLDFLQKTLGEPEKLLPVSGQTIQDPTYFALVNRYNELLQDRQKQADQVQDAHPVMHQAKGQLEIVRSELLANVQGQRAEISAQFIEVEKRLQSIAKQTQKLPFIERRLQSLLRRQQINQELYAALLKKRLETAMTQSSTISNAWIVDAPTADAIPVYPNKAVVLLISGLFGAGIPFAAIHLKKTLNTYVQTKSDIADIISAPVIGEISHTRNPASLISNRSKLAEELRVIRTNLQLLNTPLNKQVIIVTSGNAGEGKSFSALRLAQTLSEAGKRTILLELDLRKPSISKRLGLNDQGIAEIITNKELGITNFLQTPENLNIDIIAAGHSPPDPMILVSSARMKDLIAELRVAYDHILIDSPPIGLVADALVIAQLADLVLYVVRAGITRKKHLEDLKQHIANGHLPAVFLILNDTRNSHNYDQSYYTSEKSGIKRWFSKS